MRRRTPLVPRSARLILHGGGSRLEGENGVGSTVTSSLALRSSAPPSRDRQPSTLDSHSAMRKSTAASGSAVFFIIAPGVVAGLIPWWLTRWELREPFFDGLLSRGLGAVLIAAGAAVLISAFVRFVIDGAGTPAPVAPTDRLVVGGLYRYVRNPMYVAVVSIIIGQALVLGQRPLITYALIVWVMFAAFVRIYEEPTLRRRYGVQYDAYCRDVPAWLPRLRLRNDRPGALPPPSGSASRPRATDR